MSLHVHREVAHTMGMPISLALRGRYAGTARGDAAWAEVMAELRWVDLTFSTWRPDSWISRLGRGKVRVGDCPPEVPEVLGIADRASAESDGAFSVHLPGPDGVPGLDPSGVVKGWAVDRAARRLAGLAGTDWCLSAGGDLLAHADAGRPAWQVGVEDPEDPRRVLAVVSVWHGAVATSGTAHRGAHLYDGRTGLPVHALRQVTVVADTVVAADVDATTACALGELGPAWLTARGRAGVVVPEFGAPRVLAAA